MILLYCLEMKKPPLPVENHGVFTACIQWKPISMARISSRASSETLNVFILRLLILPSAGAGAGKRDH